MPDIEPKDTVSFIATVTPSCFCIHVVTHSLQCEGCSDIVFIVFLGCEYNQYNLEFRLFLTMNSTYMEARGDYLPTIHYSTHYKPTTPPTVGACNVVSQCNTIIRSQYLVILLEAPRQAVCQLTSY